MAAGSAERLHRLTRSWSFRPRHQQADIAARSSPSVFRLNRVRFHSGSDRFNAAQVVECHGQQRADHFVIVNFNGDFGSFLGIAHLRRRKGHLNGSLDRLVDILVRVRRLAQLSYQFRPCHRFDRCRADP